MIFEFNCEEFAQNLTDEASKYLSERLELEDRKFVLEHFHNCALRSARVLSQDKTLALSDDKIVSTAKIIMEWIFKVAVSLVESDIPTEFRHGIILDTGYVAFDITKDVCNIPEITSNKILNTCEYHVINKLKSMLSSMISRGVITDEIAESLLKHPYISKSEKRIEFALNRAF